MYHDLFVFCLKNVPASQVFMEAWTIMCLIVYGIALSELDWIELWEEGAIHITSATSWIVKNENFSKVIEVAIIIKY